jgi:CzcA family heavy metal efflux pump
MGRWLVSGSVRFRGLVVCIAAAVVFVGVVKLRDAPVDILPEYGPPTVEVQTEALGLSATEVEQLITVPMEQDLLNGIAFLQDIRSQSVPGLSRILLVFEPGTDIFLARQGVAERLSQAHALPQVSKPPQMLQAVSSTNRVLMVGVSSKSLSAIRMSVLARWTIVPRLMGVPGVANVSIWGQRDRQLQVQVDPERLRDVGVSLNRVLETTANALWFSPLTFVEASTPGTGGFIDTATQRLGIQHFSPITTADTLARVPLEQTNSEQANGKRFVLGDVASVVEDHQPLIGDAVVNGGGGLMLVVEKFPQANVLDVTRGVEEAIDAMRPGLSGIDFDTSIYRPASSIEQSTDNLTLALILAAVLLVLAFAAFLFRWRTAVVSLAVIPLSVITAALVLQALDKSMNAMVLAGLVAALVVVIDDAIVDVENIARRLGRHRAEGSDRSTASVILEASLEVRGPLVYATLLVVLATLPLFFLESVSGAFFPEIALAFLLALAASMAVALTVTPALSALLLAKAPPQRESPLVRRLEHGYERALERVLGNPRAAYLALGAVVLAGIATAPFLGKSLLPTFKESNLLIQWKGPPGTSLPEMNRITALATRELGSIDGVQDVGAHAGRAVTSDQVVGANSAEIWVAIDPDADYEATLASVKQVVAGYPGLSRDVDTYSNGRVQEVLAGANDEIVVRVYGEDLAALGRTATEVKKAISGIDGLVDQRVRLPAMEPTLEIKVDLAAAERYGIKPGDVRRAAATLLSGTVAGSLFEEQKVFDVVVWGTPATRSSLTSIRKLLIDTPDGGHVRLGQVANARVVPGPALVQRQAVSRYVDVTANVQGRGAGAAVADVRQALQTIHFPLESHAEVFASEGQPRGRLIAVGIAAAIAMLVLLQALFGSWRLASLWLLTLPIAVAGGLLAALIDGGMLSFGSYIGLVVVAGLAARNGVLLVTRYRRLEEHEGEPFGARLVLRGARERLPATLTTATAAAFVLLPLVVAGPRAGYELVHPLAVVVLGGLVTTTLLQLFIAPALYLRFGAKAVAESDGSLAGFAGRSARRRSAPQELPVRSETRS